MSDCAHTFEQLSAHADGELGGEEAEALEAHLEDCESCRSTLETLKATRHRVATVGARKEPTDAMQRMIERQAGRADPEDEVPSREQPWYRRAELWRGLLSRRGATWKVGAAVAVAVGLLVVGYLLGTSSSQELPGDWAETFVADHMHSKPAAKPMDVAGEDRDEIAAYFEGKVGFDPVVPEMSGARLAGGRLCELAGHKVELLLYRRDGRVLSFFVSDTLEVPATCEEENDHVVCVRRDGDLRYMLVGRGSSVEMRRLLAGAR